MKKLFASLLMLAIFVPCISFAQATTATTNASYIAELKQLLALLEQELQALISQTSTSATSGAGGTNNVVATSTTGVSSTSPAPTATISLDSSSPGNPNLEESSNMPLETIDITGNGGILSLSQMTVHFNVSGGAQVTKAYLYEGSTIPVASAVVSGNNTATFLIASGTPAASFVPNVPTPFSINVDVTGVSTVSTKNQCGTYESPSLKSIQASISSSDVQLLDSQGQTVEVTGAATGNTLETSGSGCWWDQGCACGG